MLFTLSILAVLACGTSESGSPTAVGPLNAGSGGRTQIVIISDMHLGADLAYAECNQNLGELEAFLNEVAESPTVREQVIAGDLLDEWFVPATTDTYAGKDQTDFVDRIASANAGVMGAFNRIIGEGNILVTYVPGNHDLTYAYWAIWKGLMQSLPVENSFDENIIVTNINGFTETYAINDLMPFQETPGGFIDMNLYKGSMDNWDERQTANHVPVHIPTMHALTEAATDTGTDDQADLQYFSNPDSDVRIVVFGHTHVARIVPGENLDGRKTIYVNSGTWIHPNPSGSTMNFAVITPQGPDTDSLTTVKLYRMNDGVMEELAADSVRL